MSFKDTSVVQIVKEIEENRYVIPAIQRSFVWKPEQIEYLFDSLLREYPIGGLLFWKMSGDSIKSQKHFYKFMVDYDEKKQEDNKEFLANELDNKENIIAVLDGQQRLTAMCIGLMGSYTIKKKYTKPSRYQKMCLYLNLAQENKDSDLDITYQFKFKVEEEEETDKSTWFKINDCLNPKIMGSVYSEQSKYKKIYELLDSGEEGKFAKETLKLLERSLNESRIHYYEDESKEIDDVLDIFIRTNSRGTPLSKSDLLLSTCTAYWKDADARNKINDLVKKINDIGGEKKFDFNTDFIMKCCLVLCEKNIKFEVKNFNRSNVEGIEDKWDNIDTAITLSVEIAETMGFNKDNLTSHNALIPIAYYIFKKNLSSSETISKDRKNLENIQNWMIRALLGGIFGGSTDSTLQEAREIIKKADVNIFPWQSLVAKFTELDFTEAAIEEFLDEEQRKQKTFLLLSLLHPGKVDRRGDIQIDHIFPAYLFKENKLKEIGIKEKLLVKEYRKLMECIPNKQLLSFSENNDKSNLMPVKWLSRFNINKEKWKKESYTGYLSEDLTEFKKFYDERKNLLKDALLEKLCIKKSLK